MRPWTLRSSKFKPQVSTQSYNEQRSMVDWRNRCGGQHKLICVWGAVQVLRADIMMDKLNRFWSHKNWKVRHGLLQFVAEAVCSAGEAVLAIPKDNSNWVLHKVIQLVGDPERWVGGFSGPAAQRHCNYALQHRRKCLLSARACCS
jgi:hypothetical protein